MLKNRILKTVADVKELLDELDSWFEEKGFGKSIEYSEPVSKEEIEKAEKELGVKFPPSYVEFVLKYGTFNIDGGLTGRGSGNDTNLFSPSEMVGKTNEYRDEFKDTNSEETKILQDALLFCSDPDDEFFYLFVISSADASGEMNTRGYSYHDPMLNDPWFEGNGSFYSMVEEVVGLIKQNY